MLPATVWTVGSAHYNSLLKAKQTELEMMSYVLISDFEINNNVVDMPILVFDERLNIPQSGYAGYIKLNDTLVWRSASALESLSLRPQSPPSVGESRFVLDEANARFLYWFTAEFVAEAQYVPVQFIITNHTVDVAAEHAVYMRSIWQYGALLTLVVAFLLLISLLSVLLPLRTLLQQLKQAQLGKTRALTGVYPSELAQTQIAINQLLENEDVQKQRLQNLAQDLAHALKTPLSVIQNHRHLPPEIHAELDTVQAIIQRQLKRPAHSGVTWTKAIDIANIIQKTMSGLQKIYPHIDFKTVTPPTAPLLHIDEADAYELLGNLIDNAAKAATSQVLVALVRQEHYIVITIEDDGAGVAEADKHAILIRGQRLDTYAKGQGLGLAIVNELIDLYQAKLDITNSELGGAKFMIRFVQTSSLGD